MSPISQEGSGPQITTTYVYDAFGKLAAEYSTEAQGSTFTRKFRTADHLGSTRLVTLADGTADPDAGCLDFYPFGERIEDTVGSRSDDCYDGDDAFAQQFTAKERDDESNLDYFRARYFGASLGRFTSADAPFADQFVEEPQSWNLYAYVRNNPLRYIDPTGQAIQLLGETEEDRQAELEAIRASLVESEVADQLVITKKGGEFFVGINGDIIEFRESGDLESALGAVIARDTVVEFGFDDATHTRSEGVLDYIFGKHNFDVGADFGGATTHRADASLSGNIQVIIDPNDIRPRLKEAPTPTLGETVAHELLGHALGFMIRPTAPGATTNRRAVDAENMARRRGGPARGKRKTHYKGFPR